MNLNSQKGLTLIEVLISITIIALAALTSVHALLAAHHMSEDNRGRLLAINAARSTLEDIKETGLTDLSTINTSTYVPADLPNGTITITTNPADVSAAPIATVTVTVSWTGARNMTKTFQVSTMRSTFN